MPPAPETKTFEPRVAVVQDGARLHYAVALAIQRAGCLERMFTTWYASPWSASRFAARTLQVLGYKHAASMLHRYAPELKRSRISSKGWITLYERFFKRRFPSDRARHIWVAQRVSAWIKRRGFGEANTFFGFIQNSPPDLFEFAKQKGLVTIGDQYIAPFDIQCQEDQLQHQRFPGWSTEPPLAEVGFWADYERATWKHIDRLTCASEYVRQGLIEAGIDPGRIAVVPYPIDAGDFPFVDRSQRSGPMRVGFVGAVGLRKGAGYFLEVARRFDKADVEFSMVGPVHLQPAAIEQMKPHVNLVGPVPRGDIVSKLRDFDVFFFPSTCEGSAGSVMEAMASGLPIVTTPNAGSIIESGKTGFIAAYDDIDAHAAAIRQLCDDREKRVAMARAARAAAENCSIDAYSARWRQLLTSKPA